MNPIIEAAQTSVQHGWVMGVMTIFFLFFFVAWAFWAWAPGNRSRMDAAARMPLEDDGPGNGLPSTRVPHGGSL